MSLVPIIMGSKSDLKHGQEIAAELAKFSIASEIRVASAHKAPQYVLGLLADYEADPQPKVYITVAGRSNALSGLVVTAMSGIEIALWDLVGRATNLPVYALLGGKFRDKILCYADTPSRNDPLEMVEQLKRRLAQGYQFLKMDVGIDLVAHIPGAINSPTPSATSPSIRRSSKASGRR